MKQKGFTLIELLGVLIVLALLAALVIPVVTKTVKNNKQKLYNVQIEAIEKAAKDYAIKNIDTLPEEGEVLTITLGELKRDGFVEQEIRNPITKELFSDDLKIEIRRKDEQYSYTVIDENGVAQ